jgi:hypothetical protein
MLGAVFDWWIITRSRRLFNMLLGDRAARAIYFVVGPCCLSEVLDF